MKHAPGLVLAALAAMAWGAVITIDETNIRTHAEHDLLGLACVFTALALFEWLIAAPNRREIGKLGERVDETGERVAALARVVATRPDYEDDPTGPVRLLPRRDAPGGDGAPRHARRGTR